MTALFVSDVHLGAGNAPATSAFIALLGRVAASGDALYVLGDLFDAWLGDDDHRPPHDDVVAALAQVTAAGVPVAVVHGNHDFLLGDGFLSSTGCRLLADPDVIELDGERIAVCHGDHLCTDDVDYQRWRAFNRVPDNQREFLALPMTERAERARALRAQSSQAVQLKTDDIMDVNQGAVTAMLDELGVDTVIHGHTHRPALHTFELHGRPARRFVLGAWYQGSHVLEWRRGAPRVTDAAGTARAGFGQA